MSCGKQGHVKERGCLEEQTGQGWIPLCAHHSWGHSPGKGAHRGWAQAMGSEGLRSQEGVSTQNHGMLPCRSAHQRCRETMETHRVVF